MTANQIAYANAMELARSNRAKEQLTKQLQDESKRHNIVTERLSGVKMASDAMFNGLKLLQNTQASLGSIVTSLF